MINFETFDKELFNTPGIFIPDWHHCSICNKPDYFITHGFTGIDLETGNIYRNTWEFCHGCRIDNCGKFWEITKSFSLNPDSLKTYLKKHKKNHQCKLIPKDDEKAWKEIVCPKCTLPNGFVSHEGELQVLSMFLDHYCKKDSD